MFIEEIVDVGVERFCLGQGGVVGRVCFENVFEKFARGGLAAFCHPEVGDDGVAVWAPDARDEDGFGRHDEVAGGGTSNGRQAGEGLRLVIGSV